MIGFGANGLGTVGFGSSGFGSVRLRRRSFAELVFEAGSCVEDELNTLPDQDWPGLGPDSLRETFPVEDKMAGGERVRALTSCAGHVSGQDRLEPPSCARDYPGAQPPEPLAQLARLVGRG